jgi:excisionase family DNA binding protein
MNINEKDFLSIYEFSQLLNVHHNTVRNMIKSGRLSAFRLNKGKGCAYRIARTEIQRLTLIDLEEIVEKMVEERIKGKK